MDLSHLDKKYFIDDHVYNCPFCKRGNVAYRLVSHFQFDWKDGEKCYGYLVQCGSTGCGKVSMHLSKSNLRKYIPPRPTFESSYARGVVPQGYYANDELSDQLNLDELIFYSRPTSFFTLDERLPKKIRDLIFEAEQSRQANLLVGASACLRKAIYELIEHEKVTVKKENNGYTDYQSSIKALKEKFPHVSPELFDTLANIQELASDSLHEASWEAWDSPKLRFLIELAKATLDEMYVVPDERKKRMGTLGQLKEAFEGKKKDLPQEKKEEA